MHKEQNDIWYKKNFPDARVTLLDNNTKSIRLEILNRSDFTLQIKDIKSQIEWAPQAKVEDLYIAPKDAQKISIPASSANAPIQQIQHYIDRVAYEGTLPTNTNNATITMPFAIPAISQSGIIQMTLRYDETNLHFTLRYTNNT